MRHSLQSVVSVRLAFGRTEVGRYVNAEDGKPARLAPTIATETAGRFAERLTTHSLAELRTQENERRRAGAVILALGETRKGRRKLRVMLHRHKQGLDVIL